jgi:hypothetical protein
VVTFAQIFFLSKAYTYPPTGRKRPCQTHPLRNRRRRVPTKRLRPIRSHLTFRFRLSRNCSGDSQLLPRLPPQRFPAGPHIAGDPLTICGCNFSWRSLSIAVQSFETSVISLAESISSLTCSARCSQFCVINSPNRAIRSEGINEWYWSIRLTFVNLARRKYLLVTQYSCCLQIVLKTEVT